jgi:hypothetical protein
MADPRDHDAPIWAITMGGIRTRAKEAAAFGCRVTLCELADLIESNGFPSNLHALSANTARALSFLRSPLPPSNPLGGVEDCLAIALPYARRLVMLPSDCRYRRSGSASPRRSTSDP